MSNDLLNAGAMTPAAIAAKYGVSRSRLFALMASGELPKVKLSERRVLIPTAAVEAWLARHLVAAPPRK